MDDNLPHSWQLCQVCDLGQVVAGGTPSTKTPEYWGDQISWISPADLTGYKNKFIGRGAKSISQKGLDKSSAKLMPSGSVHFSSRAPIGYTVISSQSLCTNQGFKSLVPANGVFNEYVYYYFKSIKDYAESVATGTTFKELSGRAFSVLPFPLPPLAEQKRIVTKIEELFSELDAGEQSFKQARKQLGIYRQSLLKQAFEGKLTEQWRADHPDQLEDPETLLARMGVKRSDNIKPHVCDQWLVVDLESLTEYVTSGSRGWAKYYADKGSLFIRAQNLKTDSLRFDDIAYVALPQKAEGTRTLTKEGDLLITITGANVTKAAYVERDLGVAYVSQHVALCRLQDPQLAQFLHLYVISPAGGRRDLEKAAYGAGKPGLNLTNVRSLSVPICSLPEQQEIVRLLEDQFSVIEQNEREIDAALKRSAGLRQSILKRAFSGQLVPQDPNDEPASELLARIQAERAAQQAATKKAKKKTAKKAAKKKTTTKKGD